MSELGIIGQRYEDRVTKKSGVLVSRNSEHCSLVFEGSDGKKFVVSNVTFTSKWHKVSDESTTTAAPVSEEPTKEAPVQKVEKPKKDKKSKKESESDVSPEFIARVRGMLFESLKYITGKYFETAKITVSDFAVRVADSFGELDVSVPDGDSVVVSGTVNGKVLEKKAYLFENIYSIYGKVIGGTI